MDFPFIENILHRHRGGLGVERIEDRLDHQDVAAALDQSTHLHPVGLQNLIESHHPERGVLRVRRIAKGNSERPDCTGDVAFHAGIRPHIIRHFPGELGAFYVHFPGQLVKEIVFQDLLEKLRILAPAFFTRILHEKLALRDPGGRERVCLTDIGTGLVKALVDVRDYLRLGDREDVAVVQEILLVFCKPLAACRRLIQAVCPDRRAHRAVQHHDPLPQLPLHFRREILLCHAGNLPNQIL